MVAGYAIGGGHVLHVVCDLTIAADNARFGQTGPRVGSFDGGYGASLLARLVGPKKAKEFWFLCRQYDAQQALEMGLVNTVVPLGRLEDETVQWCREMLAMSPIALRCLKAALNADCDGQAGLQELAGNATLLFYANDEAKEARGLQGQAHSRLRPNPSGLERLRIWLMAARPRTLPAVRARARRHRLAGTLGTFKPLTMRRTLLEAIFIQIGPNLSSDYSTRAAAPTRDRLGPVRVTGRLVRPSRS
jgi:hypothetical protein